MNDTLFLITSTYTKNAAGVDIPAYEKNEVFCDKKSVSRNEFFNAGRNGLNPEFVFTVFKADYQGERSCEYDGLTYSIYRTYEKPDDDYIELYVQRKGGSNGESNG